MATKKDSKKPARRRRRERATIYSDAELIALALVTPGDIEKAKASWRKSVPPKYRNLLDAKVIQPHEPD